MKMTKRAENALLGAGYIKGQNPAIEALVCFAAQNPGLEWGNYVSYGDNGEGAKAYRSEARSINQDWQRFKGALAVAAKEGVTDEDVIKAAPGAFSGRLVWWNRCTYCNNCRKIVNDFAHNTTCPECAKCDGVVHHEPQWEYCTGQYFPTEYREAAATVLEYATREVRRSREPAKRKVTTIAELKQLNQQNGGCWFEPGSMRFFGTKIESGILHGRYFITSEKQDDDKPRKFSVRTFDDEGSVDTVGDFHDHDTKEDALAALRAHIEQAEQVTA